MNPSLRLRTGFSTSAKQGRALDRVGFKTTSLCQNATSVFPLYQRSHKKDESRHKNKDRISGRENNPLESYTNVRKRSYLTLVSKSKDSFQWQTTRGGDQGENSSVIYRLTIYHRNHRHVSAKLYIFIGLFQPH